MVLDLREAVFDVIEIVLQVSDLLFDDGDLLLVCVVLLLDLLNQLPDFLQLRDEGVVLLARRRVLLLQSFDTVTQIRQVDGLPDCLSAINVGAVDLVDALLLVPLDVCDVCLLYTSPSPRD